MYRVFAHSLPNSGTRHCGTSDDPTMTHIPRGRATVASRPRRLPPREKPTTVDARTVRSVKYDRKRGRHRYRLCFAAPGKVSTTDARQSADVMRTRAPTSSHTGPVGRRAPPRVRGIASPLPRPAPPQRTHPSPSVVAARRGRSRTPPGETTRRGPVARAVRPNVRVSRGRAIYRGAPCFRAAMAAGRRRARARWPRDRGGHPTAGRGKGFCPPWKFVSPLPLYLLNMGKFTIY